MKNWSESITVTRFQYLRGELHVDFVAKDGGKFILVDPPSPCRRISAALELFRPPLTHAPHSLDGVPVDRFVADDTRQCGVDDGGLPGACTREGAPQPVPQIRDSPRGIHPSDQQSP